MIIERSCVLYSLELQLTGVILISAMIIGGFSLWLKKRKTQHEFDLGTDGGQNN